MVCPGEKEESFTVKFQRNDPRYFLILSLLSEGCYFQEIAHSRPQSTSFLGHVVLLQIKSSGSGD